MSSETSPNEGATDGTNSSGDPNAECVDPNMGRCTQLQAEWASLREEMDKLLHEMNSAVAPREEQVVRKEEITNRMSAITAEMNQLLARAQEKLPPKDKSPDADEPPARSKTGKHRVERTYDSSDSDGPPPSRPADQYPEQMSEESAAACIAKIKSEAVPPLAGSDKSTTPSNRVVTTSFGAKLRSTLRTAQTTLTGNPNNISSTEREHLRQEENRLVQELRALRKQSKLDQAGEKRAAQITTRLKEIADLNLDAGPVPTATNTEDKQHSLPKRNISMGPAKFAAKAKAFVSTAVSPRAARSGAPNKSATDQSSANPTEPTAAPPNSNGTNSSGGGVGGGGGGTGVRANEDDSKKAAAKKSVIAKRWGTLKKHAMKLGGAKTTSNNTNNSNSSSTSPKASTAASPSSVTAAASSAASGSEYTEARDRLAQRGEKLSGLGKDAEGMREGATDMLAAARALRKKNEKKNNLFS